jgi:hypothetical protein
MAVVALTYSLPRLYLAFHLQGSLCPVWNHEVLFPLSEPFFEPVRRADQGEGAKEEQQQQEEQVSEVRVVLKDRSRGLIHSKPLAQVGLPQP